jgi:hypothetical protein
MSIKSSPSDTERRHRDFWTAFSRYIEQHQSFLEPEDPPLLNWIGFTIGPGFTITALTHARAKYIAVELMIQSPEAEGFFRALEQHKAAIESELGLKLEWREMSDKKMKVISIYHHGPDSSNRDEWPSIFAWFQPKLESFHRTFAPRVKTLKPLDSGS